jgi:DNA-binding CsgD family transcriptional regulator
MAAHRRSGGKTEWRDGGLLLLDSTLTPVYAGGDVLRILLYPDASPSPASAAVRERLAALAPPDHTSPSYSTEFVSGRRRYQCHWLWLETRNDAANPPRIAVVIQRKVGETVERTRLPALFNLAPREQQAVQYLMEGLDNEALAAKLGITPHSLKALLGRVMRKMGVTTRSGILGKYVGSVRRFGE